MGKARRRDCVFWEGLRPPRPPRRSDPLACGDDAREVAGWVSAGAVAGAVTSGSRISPAGRAGHRDGSRDARHPVPEPVEGPFGREPVWRARRRDCVFWEGLRPPRPPRRSDPVRFASTHAELEPALRGRPAGFWSPRRGSRLGLSGSARRDARSLASVGEMPGTRSLSQSKRRSAGIGRLGETPGLCSVGATPPTPPRRSDPVRFASTHAEGAQGRREVRWHRGRFGVALGSGSPDQPGGTRVGIGIEGEMPGTRSLSLSKGRSAGSRCGGRDGETVLCGGLRPPHPPGALIRLASPRPTPNPSLPFGIGLLDSGRFGVALGSGSPDQPGGTRGRSRVLARRPTLGP